MIAETTQRQVVIFTGRGASPSTIELIETISQSFPHWHFTIFQEIKPRRLGPYFRGKIRRLGREPFSYLLELFGQLRYRFRLPSTGRVTGAADYLWYLLSVVSRSGVRGQAARMILHYAQ